MSRCGNFGWLHWTVRFQQSAAQFYTPEVHLDRSTMFLRHSVLGYVLRVLDLGTSNT
jgi:hypothetical protein